MNEGVLEELTLPILEIDKPTNNGRCYTKETVITEMLKDETFNEMISTHQAFGEFFHKYESSDGLINMRNVSHCVTEVELKGNILWGTIDILDTPQGRCLYSLLEYLDYTPTLVPRYLEGAGLITLDIVVE